MTARKKPPPKSRPASLLTSEDRWGHLKNLGFEAAVGPFAARSSAEQWLPLAPETTPERICSLLEGYAPVWRTSNGRGVELVFRREGQILGLSLQTGSAAFELLTEGNDAKERLEELLRRFEPLRFVNHEDDGVWVQFAHQGTQGVVQSSQFLRCPEWPVIRENYNPAVKAGIEHLMEMPRPWNHGRLVIWHGLPGTGKTYALRALMMAWRKRFDFLVVTDPERLAANPGYYYEVAGESMDQPMRIRRLWQPDPESPKAAKERKRKLFILEDSADLILQESRSSHYDKIGKLLNMTDGLFGQGRQDLFLLTFNEAVDRIDPAFLRPGRCVTRLEFTRFEREEAEGWLQSRCVPNPAVEGPQSLAELYARSLGGAELSAPAEAVPLPVGFAAR